MRDQHHFSLRSFLFLENIMKISLLCLHKIKSTCVPTAVRHLALSIYRLPVMAENFSLVPSV